MVESKINYITNLKTMFTFVTKLRMSNMPKVL